MDFIMVLIWLIVSHYLCDYVFQTDAIATGKNRNIDKAKFGVQWWHWLNAHSFTHGLGVGLVTYLFTSNLYLATITLCVESIMHWWVDFGKCEGKFDLNLDQLLHIICKVWVAGIAVSFM